jgi:hypothetical protein
LSFKWIRNTQPNTIVFERWKTHFSKPNELAPVPWFMGELTYFDDIMLVHPSELDRRNLEYFFSEVQGGIVAFTEVEQAQHLWREWYFYLLPYLVLRAHEDYLLEILLQWLC